MRILILGDVVGSSGRKALAERLPGLRRELDIDFAIVNGENAAHGYGITGPICADLYAAGADVVTTGNHVWDQREIAAYIEGDPRLLRPINYPPGAPGRGEGVFPARNGKSVLVVHPMGRLYMEPLDNPFAAVDAALANHRLGASVAAAVVDVHAEATSEKMAMAHFLDGRVSAVVGSHTHVPTADARVLPGGTAYISDLGMCGDYDSVIGMEKGPATERFVRKVIGGRLEPAKGEGAVAGLFVVTDDKTGLALRAEPLRLGPGLAPAMPSLNSC
jgi:hypothetical protein